MKAKLKKLDIGGLNSPVRIFTVLKLYGAHRGKVLPYEELHVVVNTTPRELCQVTPTGAVVAQFESRRAVEVWASGFEKWHEVWLIDGPSISVSSAELQRHRRAKTFHKADL